MPSAKLLIVAALLFALQASAQTPAGTADQAQVTPTAVATPPPKRLASPELLATIGMLREVKDLNQATLKKQQVILDTLDQLNKDADQIKIFSKRG